MPAAGSRSAVTRFAAHTASNPGHGFGGGLSLVYCGGAIVEATGSPTTPPPLAAERQERAAAWRCTSSTRAAVRSNVMRGNAARRPSAGAGDAVFTWTVRGGALANHIDSKRVGQTVYRRPARRRLHGQPAFAPRRADRARRPLTARAASRRRKQHPHRRDGAAGRLRQRAAPSGRSRSPSSHNTVVGGAARRTGVLPRRGHPSLGDQPPSWPDFQTGLRLADAAAPYGGSHAGSGATSTR